MRVWRERLVSRAGSLALLAVAGACASTGSLRQEPLGIGAAERFEGEFSEVLAAARTAIPEAGLSIEEAYQADDQAWVIIGKKGASLFSWGELVRVVVQQSDQQGEVWVRVVSERRLATNVTARGDYSESIFSSIRLTLAL